jgi:hypothetical protein
VNIEMMVYRDNQSVGVHMAARLGGVTATEWETDDN